MWTQHGKHLRKVLMENPFADDFPFRPYPTATLRLVLRRPCTQRAWSFGAASTPLRTGTQPQLGEGQSLLADKVLCLCSCTRDIALLNRDREASPEPARRRSCGSWAPLAANHQSCPQPGTWSHGIRCRGT